MGAGPEKGEGAPEQGVRLAAVPPVEGGDAATEQVRDLLAEHVPLSLLADLVSPQGPSSDAILDAEGLPDDAWWDRDEEKASTGSAD